MWTRRRLWWCPSSWTAVGYVELLLGVDPFGPWGRPFMEAMASGLVTIGTAWGGHLDFMNVNNSLLIDYELADVPESAAVEWPFFRGQTWAEPSVASLRKCLRRAYEGGPVIERLRANAALSMRDHCARSQADEAIIKEVGRLGGR